MRQGLRDVEIDTTIFRPATFIEMSRSSLNRALLLRCLLVIVVLALFLMQWRSAFSSITAIPLSLLAAALVLHDRDGVLSLGSLVGFVIVLGGSRPGLEIEHPMAGVIIGGLVTSTILNLFLMPALYLKYGSTPQDGKCRS